MEKKQTTVATTSCNTSLANAIISATMKADCCSNAAATTVALKNYKKGLSLAMQGNLWYKHVDIKSGVTSDAHYI